MKIDIESIKKLTIEPNEKLMVRMPDTTDHQEMDQARKYFNKFFGDDAQRICLYAGDVEFTKVEIKNEG